MNRSDILRIAGGGAAVIIVLLLVTWALGGFTGLSPAGVAALIAGITLTMGLGIGLMALVFYSSRSERDEAVHRAAGDGDSAAARPGEGRDDG